MATKDITDKQIVRAVDCGAHGLVTLEVLQNLTGEPEKVCIRALERAVKDGLIDYGVNITRAWLTEKGAALCPWRKANPARPYHATSVKWSAPASLESRQWQQR